ncbi:unnamed protein product [Cyprideis torosa]|uniref:Uncharacterized protein n=1 Tax=Cyprideis torosa TaxID=163714 RepID=A0A7R8W360_9CRUS|nr:unnamed protein product [Cyprideis torosa]CAG0881801.1 unnamed protein product [Cyprideis torosa]
MTVVDPRQQPNSMSDQQQSIFSTKAHVFHIDPKTKRSWIPASSAAVPVSFYYDMKTFKKGSKMVVNSTVTTQMTFTKTSQKFGQWSDARANEVYGLGFSNEAELNKESPKKMDRNLSTAEQLKYENDRLKVALAQSSANAKKWEVELQTLKSNNARLTNALQESTANVEEWKRQLHSYKEENSKLKSRLIDVEASKGNADAALEIRKEIATLRARNEALEVDLRNKEEEIRRLRTAGGGGSGDSEKNKNLEEENDRLQLRVRQLSSELEDSRSLILTQKKRQEGLLEQLKTKLYEMSAIQRDLENCKL